MGPRKDREKSCGKGKCAVSSGIVGERRKMKRIVLLIMVTVMGVLLASGVALAAIKTGTNGNDRITGTNGPDILSGKGGKDFIVGLQGPDVIKGGADNDTLFGSDADRVPEDNSSDIIEGGGGNDDVAGGLGADVLKGGSGDEFIIHGPFRPALGSVDRAKDVISCGPGDDAVLAGKNDRISSDCETVFNP